MEQRATSNSPMKRAVPLEQHYVINIKYDDDHLVDVEDQHGRALIKNTILTMIQTELGLDHFYIPAQRTILVRIEKNTVFIPLFRQHLQE
mmetsp:Transcript_19231/g.29484  ORF Transcript_19231/g.29484 Transcript_19231/m.29484 type:complete len:90 (+) Transcript_19231:696-965(+)